MARGSRSTIRWKHDRIRRKRARDKRAMVAKGVERTQASK